MSNQEQAQQKVRREIPITFREHLRGGVYSNFMRVKHTQEEFIMDFFMIEPDIGAVTARVIMSPGHLKRTIAALQKNLDKYQKEIAPITEAPPPTKRKLGYPTPSY